MSTNIPSRMNFTAQQNGAIVAICIRNFGFQFYYIPIILTKHPQYETKLTRQSRRYAEYLRGTAVFRGERPSGNLFEKQKIRF